MEDGSADFPTDHDADEGVIDDAVFDHLFSPELLAHIDSAAVHVRSGGRVYTAEEVRSHLDQIRSDWRKANGE